MLSFHIIKSPDLCTQFIYIIIAHDCIAFGTDITLLSSYFYFYYCHQASDNCYQVLDYL